MLVDGYHDIPPGKVAMIVTHLEMRAQADVRPVTCPDGVTLRRVEPDIDWYRDIFERVGSDWLWFARKKLPEAELAAIIGDAGVELYTLSQNGTDEALLELNFRQSGECELSYFGLTPPLIGTGSGRYLMNEAIKRAWSKSITRFHVHTCTIDSPQALNFYRRSGFTPIRQQVEVDDDPRLSGQMPQSKAAHVPIFKP